MAIDPKQYVHRIYRMEGVYKTDKAEWESIKDEPRWPLAPIMTLLPNPHLHRHRGWPKLTRIRNEMD